MGLFSDSRIDPRNGFDPMSQKIIFFPKIQLEYLPYFAPEIGKNGPETIFEHSDSRSGDFC